MSRFIQHVFSRSTGKLDFLTKHIVVIIIFTFIYYFANRLAVMHKIEKKEIDLFDSLHFSLVTQTTVGYGKNFTSNLYTKTANIIHLLTIYGIYFINFI